MRRECRERFLFHRLQRKPLVSDPGMHHGTCVTHVPWCMPWLLTRNGGKTFPAFPAHAQPTILRIWQEAHDEVGLPRLYWIGISQVNNDLTYKLKTIRLKDKLHVFYQVRLSYISDICNGLNMLPSDSFMSCLDSLLWYSKGSSRLCNWLSLQCLVAWINHLPPVC